MLGQFKSECRNAPKEKALMAKEGDDGPTMLMLEVCELMDNGESPPQTPATEIAMLVEEKVYLHDKTEDETASNVW